MDKETILVVDDDTTHRTMLRALIGGWGYTIVEADDGGVAIEKVKERSFDLILMDIRMLKVSGIEAMEEIKKINPAIPVIIMTAYSSVDTAVSALKTGAYDYLTKPLDFDKLRLTMARAMEHLRLKEENRLLKAQLEDAFDRHRIIGNSPVMTDLLETVSQVAPSEATVLITGESGTGKELVAGALHYNSERCDGPFIKINCAAITETLFESELFGHEKGAFTGADRVKDGRFLQAHNGTLFLDEISEMPMTMQVKLLRVLQEGQFEKVGGEKTVAVDVRIISASNQDLKQEVRRGNFREDLYYRLNVLPLALPPLRERDGDIPLLVNHFLQEAARCYGRPLPPIGEEVMRTLRRYAWPGNVRELQNTVQYAFVHSNGGEITLAHLTPEITSGREKTSRRGPVRKLDDSTVCAALAKTGGNKAKAARLLGVGRATLYRFLNEISPDEENG
jgi:two-component system response regulator HydG